MESIPEETSTDRRRRVDRDWADVRFVIAFYVLLLATSGIAMVHARISDRTFAPIAVMTVLDTLLIGIVGACHRHALRPTLAKAGFGPVGYGLVALGAPVLLFAVHFYDKALTGLFQIHSPTFLEEFEGRGILVVIGMGAVWPAVFEEIAFRGVIYGLLRRHVSLAEAFIISSFAFAILHLSVPSLVTHLPMGLYFCWLRHRSDSLWPAMTAHFLHNLGVILGESSGLL